MAYVQNNLLSSLPQTLRGQAFALLQLPQRGGSRLSLFTAFPKGTSVPPGYAPNGAYVMPYTAGDMAALASAVSLSGSASLLRGGPLTGAGTLELTGAGGLSLTVGLEGAGAMSFAGDGSLALTIGLAGDGTITMTGTGALAMIVPFAGTGAFSITGTGNLKGRLSLAGEFTPFTELSPESLAAAVWNSPAADYVDAGTMGEKLNTAGAGGLSPTQAIQLQDLHRIHGLESGVSLVVSPAARTAGPVTQTITTEGDTTTVART